jgi:hypothetical protein
MKKKIVRLMPNVTSWYDAKNKIYLTRPTKPFRYIPEDIDMTNIIKGVKAKLIKVDEIEIPEPKQEEVKIEVKVAEPKTKKVRKKREEAAAKEEVKETKEEVAVEEKNDDKEE